MRIGLYGGTFDPPHRAHLAVARAARDLLQLDHLEMIPSCVPPHRGPATASPLDRLAMVALATMDEARIFPSPREIARGGTSYTIDTLLEVKAEFPHAALYLVLGADSYDDLPNWRRFREIIPLAHWAVLPRPGSQGIEGLRPEDRDRLRQPGAPVPPGVPAIYALPMVPDPAASRVIRSQLARGEHPGDVVPPAVLRYLQHRGLYQTKESVR